MKLRNRSLLLIAAMLLLLSACGPSAEEQANSDSSLTQVVETFVAGFFATQTAMVTPTPLSTNTSLPTNTFLPTPTPYNTAAPLATWTPVVIYYSSTPNIVLIPSVTGTPPTATPNTGALGVGCNNLAIVRDVNYPSGTTVKVGEVITKTWKVQNIGSCDWKYNYSLAVVQDENFFSSWGRLGKDVTPGSWAEISVVLEMPNHDGTFTGSWRLADAGGNAFGATLSVSIVVIE